MIANLHYHDETEDAERRTEPRLRYAWDAQVMMPGVRGGHVGRMIDLNSKGAAFLLPNDRHAPVGKDVTLRLSYPRVEDGEFNIVTNERPGRIYRSQNYNPEMKRVVVTFNDHLDDAPALENEYAAF